MIRHTFAQTHPPSRPQQVAGTAAVGADIIALVLGLVGWRKLIEVD